MTPLFAGLLGRAFDELPEPLRILHRGAGTSRWFGEVEVVRGRSLFSRCCAWVMRLPPEGKAPIEVEIVAEARRELWTRHVAGHAMASQLRAIDGLLSERLGVIDVRFRLTCVDRDIVWTVAGLRLFAWIPLPAAWFSAVRARESAAGERYCFDVSATLPRIGPLVHYRGWLEVT